MLEDTSKTSVVSINPSRHFKDIYMLYDPYSLHTSIFILENPWKPLKDIYIYYMIYTNQQMLLKIHLEDIYMLHYIHIKKSVRTFMWNNAPIHMSSDLRHLDRKKLRPPGGFPIYKIPNQEPGGRGPPLKTTHKMDILCLVLRGGSSSSGFLIWKPPNKEPPPGGGLSFDQSVCQMM